jgi:hypothetical protein
MPITDSDTVAAQANEAASLAEPRVSVRETRGGGKLFIDNSDSEGKGLKYI